MHGFRQLAFGARAADRSLPRHPLTPAVRRSRSAGLMAVSLGYFDTLMSASAASTSSELSDAELARAGGYTLDCSQSTSLELELCEMQCTCLTLSWHAPMGIRKISSSRDVFLGGGRIVAMCCGYRRRLWCCVHCRRDW